MRTNKLVGYFDTRSYKKGVEKKDQPMKADGENITFGTTFSADACPVELKDYAKAYTSKDGEQRVMVTFKITQRVRWYNGQGEQIETPKNAELDGKQYEAMIDYSKLDGDPNKQEACGYWVNEILCRQRVQSSLAGLTLDNGQEPQGKAEVGTEIVPFGGDDMIF